MKNIFRELTLPAFWLLVFIVSPKNDGSADQMKKAENKELNKEDIYPSGATIPYTKNKEATFTKIALLTGISN